MKPIHFLPAACLAIFSSALHAQHAQVSAVAVQPGNPDRVWVCNRDNGTVSVVDVATSSVVAEIPVGVHPRSLAFSADGARVFVANQRGNVPVDVSFVTPFDGTEIRGTVSVIDTTTNSVTTTLTNVGAEPYGVAVAPNGKYFALSTFRSGTIRLYDAVSLNELVSFQYLRNLNEIPAGSTMADADANRDGIADTDNPRGFVIRADSKRMYVTHLKSSYVSVLDVALAPSGLPTGLTLVKKIDTDDYPFDPIFAPTPVQTLESQGKPRFLEDIALSPDGTRALVPHVLHNVNHDVNHDFGPALAGAFANRVYPALTMIDTVLDSFDQPGDASRRLHHELSDTLTPAEYVPFGRGRKTSAGGVITLGGTTPPLVGGQAGFVISGMGPGDSAQLILGAAAVNIPLGGAGTLLVAARLTLPVTGNTHALRLGSSPSLAGFVGVAQVLVTNGVTGEQSLSNGLRFVIGTQGFGSNKMGYRAGHPGRVLFNAAGNRVVMLNRGSEDVFLDRLVGGNLELASVFPPRHGFQPRASLSTTTPMGDLPLGMALVPDPTTTNDDARLYVINEATRTLSVLRLDWAAGTIQALKGQIATHQGPDAMTLSQRLGEEIFEDASRPQTAGNFNNSCGSCHFEGGDDGNVWQRPAGPRSTMPMYGGIQATGLILWKGVRINSGETGPMFGGENGGTGVFSDAEQQALTDFHEVLAVPLNPNLSPINGQYSAAAALGKDLFFGKNDTGLNPSLRHAGCAVCHPDSAVAPAAFPGPRSYTADFLDPALTSGENLASYDPDCFSLRENIVAPNIRNVNTAANVDANNDTIPDPDRNLDGWVDLETYSVMNSDKDDDFRRDDPNSYDCPCDPQVDPTCDPQNPTRLFARDAMLFSIPTKLGVFSTSPYFHDHATYTLRALLDPEVQALSPVYGSPAFPALPPYPGLNKIFNDVHDVRGHEQFVPNSSKVQATLQSGPSVNSDIEAILAYIQSL